VAWDLTTPTTSQHIPAGTVTMKEASRPTSPASQQTPTETSTAEEEFNIENSIGPAEEQVHYQHINMGAVAKVSFQPGNLKGAGDSYTKAIVIPKTIEEDVSWIEANFGGDENIRKAIYIVDDPTAELHPPKNKGNEVMVYLSYIIDHYNNLSDVNIFMHSHRFAWHNDDLLDNDAVQMIARLSAERIQREGYMVRHKLPLISLSIWEPSFRVMSRELGSGFKTSLSKPILIPIL